MAAPEDACSKALKEKDAVPGEFGAKRFPPGDLLTSNLTNPM